MIETALYMFVFAALFLITRLSRWRGGVSGRDLAIMRVDVHGFKEGQVYRISERDYFGRELWTLEGTDNWVGPDDFDFMSWPVARAIIADAHARNSAKGLLGGRA